MKKFISLVCLIFIANLSAKHPFEENGLVCKDSGDTARPEYLLFRLSLVEGIKMPTQVKIFEVSYDKDSDWSKLKRVCIDDRTENLYRIGANELSKRQKRKNIKECWGGRVLERDTLILRSSNYMYSISCSIEKIPNILKLVKDHQSIEVSDRKI